MGQLSRKHRKNRGERYERRQHQKKIAHFINQNTTRQRQWIRHVWSMAIKSSVVIGGN